MEPCGWDFVGAYRTAPCSYWRISRLEFHEVVDGRGVAAWTNGIGFQYMRIRKLPAQGKRGEVYLQKTISILYTRSYVLEYRIVTALMLMRG